MKKPGPRGAGYEGDQAEKLRHRLLSDPRCERKRHRQQLERAIQRAILDHLAWRAPAGTMWFHVGNGGFRKPAEAAILKSLGVVAGVPDLCIITGGRAFFVELKSERGRLSQVQKDCHERLRQAGAVVMTADGVDAAVAALENVGILPGATP